MRIFIQIASYRDPDLINTILDLCENATYPDNLYFGICEQYDSKIKIDYNILNIKNVKSLCVDYTKSRGACWARSLTQSLYSNEDFTLQIDSHTRCEKNWDTKILDLFNQLNDPKAIISTYPSMFTPGQSYDEYNKTIYSCHVYKMNKGQISSRPARLNNKSKPILASSVAAGFIFGPASIITDVRYDPEFYFSGEEAALAIRFFTSGYNLYHPNINLFYHYYTRNEQRKHWSDHKNWPDYSRRASNRLNCLLDRNNNFDMKEYGLGSVRSIEDWRIYSGIDYQNKKLHKYLIDNKEKPYPDESNLWIPEADLK